MATPVTCPICKQPADFFAPPLGPFCSRRCKLVDLGQWLDEEYRIPDALDPEDLDEAQAGQNDETAGVS